MSRCVVIVAFAIAVVFAVPRTSSAEVAGERATPMGDAIARLNDRAAKDEIGKSQPPLTEEAVVAAIRWAEFDRKTLDVSEETHRALRSIPETGKLPPRFTLEFVTGYAPDDHVEFQVWSVRLRIPRGTSHGTTCVRIHDQMIGSRLIGARERSVIEHWRQLEKDRGGIGSLERAEWMERCRQERAAAAAEDSAQINPQPQATP